MMYLTREERLLPLNSIFNTRDLGGYEPKKAHLPKHINIFELQPLLT